MAQHNCPQGCGYKTNNPKAMEKHIRDLKHDNVKRKASKVGIQPKKGK